MLLRSIACPSFLVVKDMMTSHIDNGKGMEAVVKVSQMHVEVSKPLNPHLGNLNAILNLTSSNCAYT